MSIKITNLWKKFQSKSYRRQFADSQISTTIAAQIVAMREDRNWTQSELGRHAGDMKQSRISALEDPSYESMTLSTLRRIAAAFDVALVVKFVRFSELLEWRTSLLPEEIAVPPFDDDALSSSYEEPTLISTSPDLVSVIWKYRPSERRVDLATMSIDYMDEPQHVH